jgi:hypothetical protein
MATSSANNVAAKRANVTREIEDKRVRMFVLRESCADPYVRTVDMNLAAKAEPNMCQE